LKVIYCAVMYALVLLLLPMKLQLHGNMNVER